MSGLLPMPSEKQQLEDEREGRAGSNGIEIAAAKDRDYFPSRFGDDFDPDDHYHQDGLIEIPTNSTSSEDSPSARRRGWFRMRGADDDEPQDWWFASTAIPLLAATLGPLANVLSIASIVGSWRVPYDPTNPLTQSTYDVVKDPHWEITLNAISLVCGFIGNLFLLFNFTRAVRYIVALPFSIFMWYLATGLLIGTLSRMAIYNAPNPANEIWGQPFWYAVMAATLYMVAAMLLMVNMLGYFLGHYTQHFELTDEQRNLILQTMMFFTWLAGGAGVFAKTSNWSYSDALYFCDVTILTVGFGDYAAPNDLGRGLVFPYSVGGIITLGLVIASISKFAAQIGHSKIVKKRIEAQRARTVQRSVTKTTSLDANDRRGSFLRSRNKSIAGSKISAPFDPQKRSVAFDADLEKGLHKVETEPTPPSRSSTPSSIKRTMTMLSTISEGRSKMHMKRPARRSKLVILREERDRFNAMRTIQNDTRRFKRYFALAMSIVAFGVVWCVGAIVFWKAEHDTQGLSYFQALYFCYVSLLTIGYGDLSPKSNAGKPFFVVWSLIAVPTMTILVSDLGDTVIAAYKRGTFTLADWSIMPKQGLLAGFLEKHPRVKKFVEQLQTNRRIKRGFDIGPTPEETRAAPSTIEQLAAESRLDEHDMAKRLARAIRRTADDMKSGMKRRYTYEEWVEFTRLIRFTSASNENSNGENGANSAGLGGGFGAGGNTRTRYDAAPEDEAARGLIEWDWIGADSPMMADQHECEWVLDRLCESLNRYMHKMVPEHVKERRRSQAERRRERMEGKSRRSHVAGIGGHHHNHHHGVNGKKRTKANGTASFTSGAGARASDSFDASRTNSATHDIPVSRRLSSADVEHDGKDDQERIKMSRFSELAHRLHSSKRRQSQEQDQDGDGDEEQDRDGKRGNEDDEVDDDDEGDDLGQMPGQHIFRRPGFLRKDDNLADSVKRND